MRINVTRSSMPDFEEYCQEIRKLWDSRWLTNAGEEHARLEEALKAYLGCPHVILFANGHLALENALASMDLPAGSEVITTPFTFASTAHAIVRNGLIPVFCDINDRDYTMDADKLESLITEKTSAIVPVHVYGNLCDVDGIQAIASRHGLKVVYDAAHAFGVKYRGVSSSNFGDACMFSFHATKVFNTIEGGAVCFAGNGPEQKLTALRNFGMTDPQTVPYVGGNAKMNEFQAAMGLCNLRHIDGEIEKRKLAAQRYRERLSLIPGIRLCAQQKDVSSNYAYFPVVFDGYALSRDEAAERLAQNEIYARKYFYPPVNSFACYRDLRTSGAENTPVAAYIAERVLTLPLYADLTPEDVDRICDIIMQH